MAHSIGIDFGTTKTLVSYYDSDSQANGYVRLGRGIDKMPTSIFIDEDGVWQFGDDADDFMSQSPSRYRRDFKLGLGKNAPYLVAKVNGKIQQFTAKDLVSRFLQNIREQCEETVFHESVTACTVTYPVAFSIAQRSELEEAAKEAGFVDVQLLPEPEAAGYAYYTFGVDKRLSKMMVVDWGGGTVDFAMIESDGGSVKLIPGSYGGAVNVGGRKFDELLYSHLSHKIAQNGGGRLEDDGDPQLNKHVCNCKEKLSRMTAVKQVVLVGSKGVYRTELDRDEFNCVITTIVDHVIEQLKELLAGCTEKPQALLLIGGSSSVPFVRDRLQAATGLPCVAWDKLNEAVAMGAAWYGSKQPGSDERLQSAGNQDRTWQCVLHAMHTGKTVCVEKDSDGQLIANCNNADDPSRLFTLIKNDDGSFSLKSEVNGKYVSAVPPPYGNCRVVVLGPKIDAWEKFELKRVANTSDVFALRSLITGKYVSVEENNENRLVADREKADEWEQLRILLRPSGTGSESLPIAASELLNEQQRCWKSGTDLENYITESRESHEDFWYFWRSAIVAQWRLNPVLSSAMALGDELEKISENEDSKVIAIRVRQGLNSISLGEFDEIVKSASSSIGELVKECFHANDVYEETYPQLKALSLGQKFSDEDAQFLEKDVLKQLRQLRGAYNDIRKKYEMLLDGFARYDKVMAGGSMWKTALLGGALGWFSFGLGVIAAVAWGGWEHMNNKDFVKNYSSAIQDFLSSCDAFTNEGQKLLLQIAMSKQDLWNREFVREETYLRELNNEGLNLDEVDTKINEKSVQDFQKSPEAMELNGLVALALQILKQDAPISETRIKKIVERLRKGGALLSEDGAVDETAVQALVPKDTSGEDALGKFREIVSACSQFNNFYILDAIPHDKLVNALHDYGNGLNEENVLCLYDSTFFGGGGDGFLIAPGGICSKQLGCEPCTWIWSDIKNIRAPEANGNVVRIDGTDVDVPTGGASAFASMFRKLKELLA